MPKWLTFLLLILAFWIALMLSLKALAGRLRQRAHLAVARLARCEGALRTADAALRELTPPDLFPTGPAPQGALLLTPSRLAFQPWASPAPLLIHRRGILKVGVEPPPMAGAGAVGVLLVEWNAEGATGKAAFLVGDAEGWARDLERGGREGVKGQ